MKNVLVLSDPHCGHKAGLTPPAWRISEEANPNIFQLQEESWNWYAARIKRWNKIGIDWVVVNGDAVDGKGPKSGGSEQISNDPHEQQAICIKSLEIIECDNFLFTYGTTYHTGEDDNERYIAEHFGADIRSHAFMQVYDKILDIKHHIGNSQVPWTKGTAVSRDRFHNLLWSEIEQQDKAHVIVRSHVHKYFHCGDCTYDAFTTPALQTPHTKFGARRCSNTVDFGFLVLQFKQDGGFSWQPEVRRLSCVKPPLLKVV